MNVCCVQKTVAYNFLPQSYLQLLSLHLHAFDFGIYSLQFSILGDYLHSLFYTSVSSFYTSGPDLWLITFGANL